MSDFYVIGFGSQASAWAQNARRSGVRVHIYVRSQQSASYARATQVGFEPRLLSCLAGDLAEMNSETPSTIAILTSDTEISKIYQQWIAPISNPLVLVLAHGYAVYAKTFSPPLSPGHSLALLAPKAIGPQLEAAHAKAWPATHGLVAAIHAEPRDLNAIHALGKAMGFSTNNLVLATFEEEAMGDLISEQGLLCGGLFALLEPTMESMRKAGVPARLIREECITELELIAGLLRSRGLEATFSAISEAAAAGAIAQCHRLREYTVAKAVDQATADITSRAFPRYLEDGKWRAEAKSLRARLKSWDELFVDASKGAK